MSVLLADSRVAANFEVVVQELLYGHRNRRFIRDGEKGGGGRGYEDGGRRRLYTYRYTVTTRMTSALRWAAMRAILMFQ